MIVHGYILNEGKSPLTVNSTSFGNLNNGGTGIRDERWFLGFDRHD